MFLLLKTSRLTTWCWRHVVLWWRHVVCSEVVTWCVVMTSRGVRVYWWTRRANVSNCQALRALDCQLINISNTRCGSFLTCSIIRPSTWRAFYNFSISTCQLLLEKLIHRHVTEPVTPGLSVACLLSGDNGYYLPGKSRLRPCHSGSCADKVQAHCNG